MSSTDNDPMVLTVEELDGMIYHAAQFIDEHGTDEQISTAVTLIKRMQEAGRTLDTDAWQEAWNQFNQMLIHMLTNMGMGDLMEELANVSARIINPSSN